MVPLQFLKNMIQSHKFFTLVGTISDVGPVTNLFR